MQALPGRSTRELQEAWQRLIRLPQPRKLSRDLLVRILADKLQQAALGGFPPAVKRKLAALARSDPVDRDAAARSPLLRLKPGSKLVREWRGRTHTILVLEDGFEYDEKRFASLTQIARAVTGTHWSGPRFFGLTRPQRPDGRTERGHGA
ncbi:MAG: DUF2924 domain-containing protein [Geminicoccaceae bacterium]